MSDMKTTIRLHLDGDLVSSKIIEVDAVAEQLLPLFPDATKEEVSQAVFEVVVAAGGNAAWTKTR